MSHWLKSKSYCALMTKRSHPTDTPISHTIKTGCCLINYIQVLQHFCVNSFSASDFITVFNIVASVRKNGKQLLKPWVDLYLLYTDEGHWLCRYRLLHGYRGHRLDENHASLLQSQRPRQRAGQGVGALWRLRGGEGASWAGAWDQTQVLQGEVEDGGAGAVQLVGLLGGARRVSGGSGSRPVTAEAGWCDLQGWDRSGACGRGSWWS